MDELLARAVELHQGGQFAAAARLYQQMLNGEPENVDALHLYGVLRHQQGDHAKAVELIGRAVALRPSVTAFHANLAEAYRALGQFERAGGCCRTAIRLWPNYPEAHSNLGLALQGQGKHDEAVAQFHRALELRPEMTAAHSNLAISLRELGRHDEALEHFRRAVELDPQSASAQTNLGQMLVDIGRAEEALPHCEEAVRLQPDVAALHHNLGNTRRALGKFVEARSAYLEALRLDPNLARSCDHLGLILHQDGQLGDALPWLKQAVDLEPDNPNFWEHLGELYGEREQPAEAIPCWERVLLLGPERAGAHNALGWALQEEGRLREAGDHYRAALKVQPDSAAAQMNLGGLYEELGEMTEAEVAFRAALTVQPGFALPHARLATLLRGKLPDADLAALETRLADTSLDKGPRARMLFALAHVLDERGEYARAAMCLKEGNALSKELAHARQHDYVPAEHERFVDSLIEVFNPDFFARTRGMGSESRRPVFVFGLPRSGTTLLEQVLAAHPRVHGAGELRLARDTFEMIPAVLGRSQGPLVCIPHLDGEAIRALAGKHLDALQALDATRERVADKMPDNYMYVGLLATLFPQATLIHCRRDLRDVAVSCWMTDFRAIRWANDPEHIAARFQQYRRVTDHWRHVLPVAIHEVDYADTVADLEGVARRVIAACGLEWNPACLEFHRVRRPVRTASVTQVRQPIYKQSVARWRNYEGPLADLFARLPVE
jgi:tetratricopeptide (TPR) repeat protein